MVKTLLMRLEVYTTAKKKNNRNIYGKATDDEIKDLKEEGINTEQIPWINDKEN